MPMPLCHILRARLRQQGKGDKSTLPARDNSKWSLQQPPEITGFMEQAGRKSCSSEQERSLVAYSTRELRFVSLQEASPCTLPAFDLSAAGRWGDQASSEYRILALRSQIASIAA